MSDVREDAIALQQRLLTNIPMAGALHLRIVRFDGRRIRLEAPLAPNINDKSTGFAGSIASLAALSGWCLMTLIVDEAFGRSEVALYKGELVYNKPVLSDFAAETMADETDVAVLFEHIKRKGKGRITLPIEVIDATGVSFSMQALYAVRIPDTTSKAEAPPV